MNFALLLDRIAESPEAAENLSAALAYCYTEHWNLVMLHTAAAADALAERYPGEYHPVELSAYLVAAFLKDSQMRAAAPLN